MVTVMKYRGYLMLLATLFLAGSVYAQNASTPPGVQNDEILEQIREEGLERSQIMKTLHMLTDRFGPRLTGSPTLERAGEWVLDYVTELGLTNAHKEPWDFGYPGWENERFSAHIVSPMREPLVGEVLGWTPSTSGPVTAGVYHLMTPDEPTEDELNAYFASVEPFVIGKIVLVGQPGTPNYSGNRPMRRDDEQVKEQYNPDAGGQGGRPAFTRRPAPERREGALSSREVARRVDTFLLSAGAQVRINAAGMIDGIVRAFWNRTFDTSTAVPTVILRDEDFGRLARLIKNGESVAVEIEVENTLYPEGATTHNYIAEILGTEKPEEVVLLGGHLDSIHAGTGATDNGTGSSIMIEALRILQALDLKPRRTIRLALWSGEEQGLLGSQAYVADHFGTYEDQKPEYTLFGGYINVDSGTGKLRGVSVFGPRDAAVVLHDIVQPLSDLGVAGARASASRRIGGSDHTSFNHAGLPGISMAQDPIRYFTHTWHTNLDTYEQVLEDDVKQASVVVAWTIYQLAMRDELLPRFSDEEMPPLNVGTQ